MYLRSFEIILLILRLQCDTAVLDLQPIFSPEPSYNSVLITSPGALQCQVSRAVHFNSLSVTIPCVSHNNICLIRMVGLHMI